MQQITEAEFERIAKYIKSHYGIYLKEEKTSLVAGRLSNVLLSKNMDSFSEYFDYVISEPTGLAVVELIDKITTNHTFFMREVEHFEYFRNVVLPYLSQTVADKDLRIWSAGCSSGEEPYTLAMILDEYFGREKCLWDSKILATDICNNALKEAKNGIYSNDELAPLPALWKQKHFDWYNADFSKLNQQIQNEVIFRRFNLMDAIFPFKRKFHVIFCRNVMIYFDNETKHNLVNKFYDIMEEGGFLFIGHSESLDRDKTRFKYVMPALYRKE